MDERFDSTDKLDEVLLPGFRFHPTDEELVGFYLKRKIQKRPLSIELIKQLDIYKFDPWDLAKEFPVTGEKEWYFYCPRGRKYRNSTRPNRVTGAGFWKATGTDRPIYSSKEAKCIGLKKSLVFYRGRAARGIKTEWMMHEFRLPSSTGSTPNKSITDQNPSANDSWAICRIFKKTNSTTQRVLSHLCSPNPENSCTNIFPHYGAKSLMNLENSCSTKAESAVHLSYDSKQPSTSFNLGSQTSTANMEIPADLMFSGLDLSILEKSNIDETSMNLNLYPTSIDFGSDHQQSCAFVLNSMREVNENMDYVDGEMSMNNYADVSPMNSQWGIYPSANFPVDLP